MPAFPAPIQAASPAGRDPGPHSWAEGATRRNLAAPASAAEPWRRRQVAGGISCALPSSQKEKTVQAFLHRRVSWRRALNLLVFGQGAGEGPAAEPRIC